MAFEVNLCRGRKRSCPACRAGRSGQSVPEQRADRRSTCPGRGKAFARHVVNDVQHPEPPPAGELVMDEVQRPARVRLRLNQNRRPRADRSSPCPALAHRQALLAVEPVDAIDP